MAILKPLTVDGAPFTVRIPVDHSVTSLITLPEGSFYTVETLVRNPVDDVPYRPVVDYMYFQQHVSISKATGKQAACIIQIRNKNITEVIVKGYYTHGVEQIAIDQWKAMCITYKDVPLWMNWIACLDDVLQVHPNVKRMVTHPAMDKRTLSDVEVEMSYIASQFLNGDSLLTSHIEYWQQQLFQFAEDRWVKLETELKNFLTKMKDDISTRVGDFLFTSGDGKVWSDNKPMNEYFNVLLGDRGTRPIGSAGKLPEGDAYPSTRTRLFNRVENHSDIQGRIETSKLIYKANEIVSFSVFFDKFTYPIIEPIFVEMIDMKSGKSIMGANINTAVSGQVNRFNIEIGKALDDYKESVYVLIRLPEYMWIQPVRILVEPTNMPVRGWVDAKLQGYSNVGTPTTGGYVNEIKTKFDKVGTLQVPTKLFVHVRGNYPPEMVMPGYPALQEYSFPTDFVSSEPTVVKFRPVDFTKEQYRVTVTVSKSTSLTDVTAIVNQNSWYLTSVPINPYIGWHYATKDASGRYEVINSITEGSTVYLVGKLSVSRKVFGPLPQLRIDSRGVGAAVEGVDFVIDRSVIDIDEYTIAYKITLPSKPELEVKYKFLWIGTVNSNVADLWIIDKYYEADIRADWHASRILVSPNIDWTSEKSTFFLHIKAPNLADGTVLNLSLVKPEMYRPYFTFTPTVTTYRGVGIVECTLDAPKEANDTQMLVMNIQGPGINYDTIPLLVVDSEKPYYEVRYIVNSTVDAVNAYPGDTVRCQARGIGAGNLSAAVRLGGGANTSINGGDFVIPPGNPSLLRRTLVNTTEWTDLFVDNVKVRSPMRSDFIVLITDIIFPTNEEGVKMGKDSNKALNMRTR